MPKFSQIFTRGITFAQSNPQIIYTLFLVIAIPAAFFFTNEQFSQIATTNQNRLQYDRISFLHDGFSLFASAHINDPLMLSDGIAKIAKENETMIGFRVLGRATTTAENGGKRYPIIASMKQGEIGSEVTVIPEIDLAYSQAASDIHHTYHTTLFSTDGRYWESVRGIPATSSLDVAGFIVTDISMAQADALIGRKILQAYAVSVFIMILILILLARQARILDYATLYKRLEGVDKMKDDFVSMAAHELRSPLTVIRGYVDLISDYTGIAEEHRKILKQIDQSAQQLNMLVGDILDVAKLQEGRMSFNYQTLDVSQSIEDVVESFMKPAKDKELTLFYAKQELPSISIDPDRFRQVIINLVGNAIKYTPKGEVRVMAYAQGDRVYIRVSDTGLGMSAEEQEKLFEKFYRVKNKETERITGTGLGLWITSSIVKSMSGTIAVESIKWKGTDFIVSFPVAKKA